MIDAIVSILPRGFGSVLGAPPLSPSLRQRIFLYQHPSLTPSPFHLQFQLPLFFFGASSCPAPGLSSPFSTTTSSHNLILPIALPLLVSNTKTPLNLTTSSCTPQVPAEKAAALLSMSPFGDRQQQRQPLIRQPHTSFSMNASGDPTI